MKNSYVADTMAVVLWLEQRKLGSKAKTIFGEAEKGKVKLGVPAMVLAEIGYLAERKKIDTNLKEVNDYCMKHPMISIEAITEAIIQKSFEIDDIPELHDRIIAGTARLKNAELITNDPIITASNFISAIW